MKGDSFRGLRVRLVLLVLLAVIPSLLLIIYTARVERLLSTQLAHSSLSQVASLAASRTSGVIERARQLLGGLAQFDEVRRGDSAACGDLMAKLLTMYLEFSALGLASPEGKLICSAAPLPNAVSVTDRRWFQQALQSRSFTVGEYEAGGPTGEAFITFACPIEDAGRIQSVVFAALDLKQLGRWIGTARIPDGGVLVVVDRQETVLADIPEAGLRGQTAKEASLIRTVKSYRGQSTIESTDDKGEQRIHAFSPISGKRGTVPAYVNVNIPTAVALAEVNQRFSRNLLGLGIVSLLALLAAWYGGHAVILGKANSELEKRVQERTKELAHEQMLLRMLMDNVPDTIYFKDAQSRFTRINRAQAEVLGLQSPDQAIGKTDSDFFTPEHAQAALADERRILESGQSLISKTERIRRADGQFRWVTATKVPLRQDGGQPVGLVGISRDITDRVKVETLLHNVVESVPDLVFVKDTEGRYVVDNASHRAFLALKSVEEVVGKTVFDFYPRELAEHIHADDQAVLQSQKSVLNRQEQFTDHHGRKIPVLTSKIPYRDEQGNFAGLVCVSRIIAESK